MGVLLKVSIRNILRQKGRNLSLSIGITFGMIIFIIANSFATGITDILFNEIVVYVSGHVQINGFEGMDRNQGVIRDKERIINIINKNISGVKDIEEKIGSYGKVIGNRKSTFAPLIGIEGSEDFYQFFKVMEGNIQDYTNKEYGYPCVLSVEKAAELNVKLYDQLKVRVQTPNGQQQSAKLTVIALIKNRNVFMNFVIFVNLDYLKEILGYKPYETGGLQIVLEDPKNATEVAGILHEKMKPNKIAIRGSINDYETIAMAFSNTQENKDILLNKIKIISGDKTKALSKTGLMISNVISSKLNLNVGDKFEYNYKTKFRGDYKVSYVVDAIYDSLDSIVENSILLNEKKMYSTYFSHITDDLSDDAILDEDMKKILISEWKLLERSKDFDEWKIKNREAYLDSQGETKYSVSSMYEVASDIIKLEGVLNLITIGAVCILFFIILIGVINSLRMTIRERTREIGTIRAIGMQRRDVMNIFILETFLLTLFSCILGILLSFLIMKGLGAITINTDGFLTMLLKNKHINFKFNPSWVISGTCFILIISVLTAFFPARKAARLSAATALRHYE